MNYKLKVSPTFDRLGFAKWVLSIRWFQHDRSVKRAMMMADDLIRGCEFELYLSDEEKSYGEVYCTITEIKYVDPYAEDRRIQADPYAEDRRIQAEYFALRDRGAAGDAEAAIAYCKLEVQGLPNHGAMA